MTEYEKKSVCPENIKPLIKIANSNDKDFNLAGVELQEYERKLGYITRGKVRKQLRFIARCSTIFTATKPKPKSWKKGLSFPPGAMESWGGVIFHILENKYVFSSGAVVEALQGVDADRLKLCGICDKVFWAKKWTAKTCGKDKCVQAQKYLHSKSK